MNDAQNLRYPGVDIKNFTDSWRDGLAFNALIHNYRPNLFNYDELFERRSKMPAAKFAEANLEHAFDVAQRHLQIERLLDVEGKSTFFFNKEPFIVLFYY